MSTADEEDLDGNTGASAYHEQPNFVEFNDALKTGRFWHMALLLFFGMFYGLYVASVYKTTAQNSLSDLTLTIAGAIGSVCNGSSRIAWATL